MDINQVTENTDESSALVRDMFEYRKWTQLQVEKGQTVKEALMNAVEAIIACAPPGPDRSVAIRKLREARMDCNSAIMHNGKY